MQPLRIAINGFGRIGRVLTRIMWGNPAFEIVAINSRSDADMYAHLLKYDSIYGPWDRALGFEGNEAIIIDGKKIKLYHENEVGNAPWRGHEVDVVIESSGAFRDRASSEEHLAAGANYVVISAPAKDEDITMVYNVNHTLFDPAKHKIISAASCTTTALAPVADVLHKQLSIVHGTIMTTHAYTNDQHLVDAPHKGRSFRRSRASAMSIVPTSTGAAKTTGKVIPALKGLLDGNALRVPVAVPSILSFVCEVKRDTTPEEVNAIFEKEKVNYPGSLDVSHVGLVSADYIRSPYGATVDALSTLVTDKRQVFVQAWYDNEWGYVTQLTYLLRSMKDRILGNVS